MRADGCQWLCTMSTGAHHLDADRDTAAFQMATATAQGAHDVSILIGSGDARCLGMVPRAKTSMTNMRAPQHGHGVGQMRGPVSSICVFGSVTGSDFGTASNSRARAIAAARLPLASRP